MLESFLGQTSAAELAARMAATALVVILVASAVRRFGPVVGGALAGLPIVLGPGFYFLLERASPAFVAEAATYSVLALCATQAFLLAYVIAATRASPMVSLCAAAAGWAAIVLSLRLLPSDPLLGTVVYIVLTLCARWLSARVVTDATNSDRREGLGLLLLRGCLAGLLVAIVTAGANSFGPEWSGLLLGFPIGFTVISVTIHEQLGRASAIATLHSALLGTASLTGFCAALALAAPNLSPDVAFVTALATSCIITLGLLLRAQVRWTWREL